MLRLALILVAVLAGVAAVVVRQTGAAPAEQVVLTAKLTGKYLHTGANGSGTARVTLKANQVCWRLSWSGLGKVAESGIHKAPPPPTGRRKRSVLPFKAVTTRRGCASASPATIEAISANPSGYYVDIHSMKYPKGAIGGRLRVA
jgi:CHRD domain